MEAGEGEGGLSGLEGPLDGDGDDIEGLQGALKDSLLESVNKAAAAALATSDSEVRAPHSPATPTHGQATGRAALC